MNVFILEDEIHSYPRNAILDALKDHNLTVATSKDHALSIYRGPYDLLLLDHDMRGFFDPSDHPNTGYQFVRWLTEFHPTHKTPVILHSQNPYGRAKMREVLQAANHTVVEYAFSSMYVEWLRQEFGQ